MVNKDIIIIKDLEKLEEIIKTIQEILGNKRLNPANIRFSNVVIKFTLPKGDGEPKIIRKKKWYGHYRTPAFNKYMKWRHSVGEGEGQLRIPDADREWSSAQQDSANPPMLQAVNSLLKIAQETLESAGNAELPDGEPLAIRILDIHTGPDGGLHQISSIQDFATEIVNDPAMYAGGASTSRRIILLRLRKKFEEQIFEVGANESEYLNFIPGFTNIIGTDEGFTMKLSFPPSAGALKSLMKNIPGLDLSTITRPAAEGAPPEIIERYREGVIIKSLKQINKMTKLLPKLKRENNG